MSKMVVSCHPKSRPLGIRVIVVLLVSLHFGTVILEPLEDASFKPNLGEAVQILTLFEMKIANDPANVPQDVKDKWSAIWTKTDGTAILQKVMGEQMENDGELSEKTQKMISEIVKEVRALPHLKTMDPFLGILHGKYLMWYKIKDKFSGQVVKFKREIKDKNPGNKTLEKMHEDLKIRETSFGVALTGLEKAVTEYGQKWKNSKAQPGENDQKLVLDEVRKVGNTVSERLLDSPLSRVIGWHISPLASDGSNSDGSDSNGSLDPSDDAALAAPKSGWPWKVVVPAVGALVVLAAAALLLVYYKKARKNPTTRGGAAIGGLKKTPVTPKSSRKTPKSTATSTPTQGSSKPSGPVTTVTK